MYQGSTRRTGGQQSSSSKPGGQQQSGSSRDYQGSAIEESVLKWSSFGEGRQDVIVSSSSDVTVLRGLRNVLLSLQDEFVQDGSKVIISGEKKDEFNKRLLLLESQVEGLMKRKIDYSARDVDGGRILDYTGILNEKQNQIVELQKKINNLEERLRKATSRETELENHIAQLYADLKRREQIIISKNQIILSEVAVSNAMRESLNKLKRNIDSNKSRLGDLERSIMEGVQLPQVGSFEIKSDLLTSEGAISRSKNYQSMPQNRKYKTQIIQLFRQFERINNAEGISDEEIQKTMEGFLISFEGTRIKQSVEKAIIRRKMEDDYLRLKDQFAAAVGILQGQVDRLKRQNPNFKFDVDSKIFDMMREHKISVYKTSGDVVHLERFSQKTIEVPVQDARTKHLMHLLAVEMRRLSLKYPKILDQMDTRLTEFFQQELIDIIEVDQMDRLVQIVKYVPQVVKVQNVYAYSSEKSRKVEFHLRILIKALLEELQKLKVKTGAVLEIDQGVIGMINQEIMGVVDVDDILKVFRIVPKIVEVEKVVEKIVDRIVQVPQVIPVQKVIEKIVEVQTIKEVERIVNVPLEIPMIVTNTVEKIVPIERVIERTIEVPQIVERIVQVKKEVPKIVEVDKFIEKVVEVERIIEVEKVVNHIAPQIQQIETIKQKVVATEKVTEKIVEVPVIVEKIVEKVVQVPQIIQVEKVIEKVVPQIQYRNAKEIENYIEVRHNVVDRIIEKPVPIVQVVEKIVQVPQIVQKVITVTNTIRQPYEVQILREKIVVQEMVKQIQTVIQKPVTIYKDVVKEVEKIIQVPVIHQVVSIVQQFIQKPIIRTVENTIIKEVYIRDPVIIHQPKTVEVEKIVNHYIEVPKPIKYIEQKIVEVIRHIDRIKQIKVPVQKIIQKMVEVPKVVEVEKIVEKVVVVPRVIEKVVQVPQIVERVVPKIMIEERVKEVQRTVQVPVIQERPKEVEIIKNVYIEVQKIVEVQVDQLVEVPKYEQKIINNEVVVEKVISVIKQVPRDMQIQKIVHNTIEVPQVIEIQKQVMVPIQVPVPYQTIIEKLVPMTEVVEKIVQVPQIMEKIVTQKTEDVRIQEIVKYEDKIVVNTQVREVVKEVPYIRDQIKEVQTVVQKIVPVQSIVQEVVTAQQIVEKVVDKTTVIPKIYEVQRFTQKVIEVPKIVEVEKIIPQLVKVNQYIQNVVEKIVEVPIIVKQIQKITEEREKIIQVRDQSQKIVTVDRLVEHTVILEKFKQVVRNINHIEKVLQVVDRYEQTPVEIISHEQKLVEVPYILEKIVEKIVVMPQIVQVLKYVHEVVEQQHLGVAINVDVATHEERYKMLSKDLKINLGILLSEIKKIKGTNPNLRGQIQIIEKFLQELEKFILIPRIVQVPTEKIVEKIVEKDKIVQMPKQDQRSLKMQLTLSLLVQKLIIQMKRLKQQQPNLNLQLEDDIRLIFFTQLNAGSHIIGDEFNHKLKTFSDTVYRKFESLGHWSYDHQMMLNSFLQQRFLMANLVKNANFQIEKSRTISFKRQQALKSYQTDMAAMENYIHQIRSVVKGVDQEQQSVINNVFRQIDIFMSTKIIHEPMRSLSELEITDQRIQSMMRTKDAQINKLRDQLFSIQKSGIAESKEVQNGVIRVLQDENLKLKNENSQLRTDKGSAEIINSYKRQIEALNNRILEVEQEKSDLNCELINLKKQYKVKMEMYNSQYDWKGSALTKDHPDQSQLKSPPADMTSPVTRYDISSPKISNDSGIKLIDSQIQGAGTASRGPTYGTSERQSGTGYNMGQSRTGYTGENTGYTGSSGYTGSGGYSGTTGGNIGTRQSETGGQSGTGQSGISQSGTSVTGGNTGGYSGTSTGRYGTGGEQRYTGGTDNTGTGSGIGQGYQSFGRGTNSGTGGGFSGSYNPSSYRGTGQSGTGQSGTGQSGTGQSGTGQSGTGTGQSGTGTGQSGSGTGQSGSGTGSSRYQRR